MGTKRQHKVSRMILKDLAEIFLKDFSHSFGNAFITLTDVEISPDLAIASVYISVMGISEKQNVIDQIEQKKSYIRGKLGRRIGKQTRIVPDLHFFLDETEVRASRLDSIIEGLDIPPESEPTDN